MGFPLRLPRKSLHSEMLGKKAVSGKVITVVIGLVIAIIALILLWAVLTNSMPLITKAVEDMIKGFKKMICDNMVWGASNICSWALGA